MPFISAFMFDFSMMFACSQLGTLRESLVTPLIRLFCCVCKLCHNLVTAHDR